jgi:prepilin-type N-terminal cleavage/methylation domain-containing protein
MLTGALTERVDWSDARGYTLTEVLVAMVAGAIVIAAMVAVFGIALAQQSRISDRVAADQTGRTAMGKIVEELRSSCTGFGATSIQAPSTTPVSPLASLGGTNLWFLSAYGNTTSGAASPSEVTLHDVNWTTTGTSNENESVGTLTDYSFAGSGAPPNWKFASLSTTNATTAKVLAKDVVPTGGALFHYRRYETSSTATNSGELIEIPASELATVASNKKVAEVTIGFTQAPEAKAGQTPDTRKGHTTSFSDSVALRFTPTESTSEGWSCT